MKNLFLILLFVTSTFYLGASEKKGNVLKIERFGSKYIDARDIYIWTPADYNPETKYAVLYMHDGQMLFDSLTTWNKQEWQVDETMDKLSAAQTIEPTIVVGIANIPQLRYSEYFPQKVYENIEPETKELIRNEQFKSEAKADNYLKFIVEELKPYIDSAYATLPDQEHTFVMGSSMGGLISLYALCEYPDVFGGAGCLSMHSPMVSSALFDKVDIASKVTPVFCEYLKANLPKTNTKKIYIDHGDQTLDSHYAPYQKQIDGVFESLGWKYPYSETCFYPGTDHSEKSWAKRLDIPLTFLLENQ